MKKTLLASALGAMLVFAPALAQTPIKSAIIINGQILQPEPPAMEVDGEIMLPLRSVFKALGADVSFKDKAISASRGSHSLVIRPNEKKAIVDNKEMPLAVPAQVFSGSTYVPLGFVAKAFGDEVSYDEKTDTINVKPAGALPQVDLPPDRSELLKGKLKRLVVGNQGAILKIWTEDGSEVAYYRGLDDRDTAPYSTEDQASLISKLEMSKAELEEAVLDVMDGYNKLPKKNALAFVGLVHSLEPSSPYAVSSKTAGKVKEFLLNRLKEDKSVVMRRQACLSLAVGSGLDQEILTAILDFYKGSENLWETFPVQQFFQYHAAAIRELPNFSSVRAQCAAVNSLYTANILSYLDGES